MPTTSRFTRIAFGALPLVFLSGMACGGGVSGVPGEPHARTSDAALSQSVRAAATPADLAVPTNTIIKDVSGQSVLPPAGTGSVMVDDRGAARDSIPIWVPPGRAGIQPSLSLQYSSSGGNGLTGTGWALAGLSRITRCKGLRLNGAVAQPILWNLGDSYCLDGEELVGDSDHYFYRKFHDDGSRVVHQGALTTPTDGGSQTDYFVLEEKSGRLLTFGGTPDSHVNVSRFLPTGETATMTWALSRVEDRAGNFMTVTYGSPGKGGDIVPQEIDYTGSASNPTTQRSVKFVYDLTRPDVDQRVVSEQNFTYSERLVRLEMNAPNSAGLTPLRTFSLGYTISPTTGRSLLSNVAECDGPAPASIPVTGSKPLCRQESFTYAQGAPLTAINSFGVYNQDSTGATITDVSPFGEEGIPPNLVLLDVDADGRDDVLYMSTDPAELYYLRLSTGTAFGPAINTNIPVAVPHNPEPMTGVTVPVVLDFDGDGHADVLVNQGPSSAPVANLYLANKAQGSWTLGGPDYTGALWSQYQNYQTADLNGDSRPDLVMFDVAGVAYYSINTNGLFSGLTSPQQVPSQDPTDFSDAVTNYFVDMNNDGVTDLITKFWTDSACYHTRVGVNCDCRKMSYGAIDVFNNLYAGYATGASSPLTTTHAGGLQVCTGAIDITPYSAPLFGDFNGDGVVDAIQTYTPNTNPPSTQLQLQMSLGGGDQSFTLQTGGSLTFANANVLAMTTIDANLDGKTDLLVRAPTGATLEQPYTIYSWQNAKWQATPVPLSEDPANQLATLPLIKSGDINGDGVPDLVAYAGNNTASGMLSVYIRQTTGPRPDVLTGVSGSFGPATTVHYAPYLVAPTEDRSDCQTPLGCVARGGWLVSEVDVDNGLSGAGGVSTVNAVQHSFASGRVDALGWGFLGFKTHTIFDETTGATATRSFDFSVISSGATPFYPFVGMPTEVDTATIYESNSQSVTRTSTSSTTYTVQGTGPFMSVPTVTESVTTDSNSATPIASMTAQRAFDAYGNVTSEQDFWPVDSETRATTTTYLNDTANWFIGRPTLVTTTSTMASGETTTRQVGYTYDSLGQLAVQIDNPGAADGSSYDPLPAQSDGVQTRYTRYWRDSNGMPDRIERLDNLTAPTVDRVTNLQYDATEGMYVVETTDPVGLVTQSAYEPGLGVLAAQTDAAGTLTTYQYDTFGRIRADHPAAGGNRSVTYHGATSGNSGSIEDHRLGQYDVVATLDSLRRTVGTTTTGRADGQAVYNETTYDALGHVQITTRPHFAGVTPAQTVTTYDNLGRVRQVTQPDGSSQITTYLGRQTTTTNPDGNMSQVNSDTLGRPVTSVQATTTGPSGLSGHVTTTTLGYGPFGVLETSTDTLGNVERTTSDRLGRPQIRHDVDSGIRVFTYDVFGEVTDDLRGATEVLVFSGGHSRVVFTGGEDTQSTYDGDGRLLTKTAPDVGQTFTWDTVYAGKLSSETLAGGTSIAYAYDNFGNVKSKAWNGPRGAIGYSYTYDKYNRLSTTTYPTLPTTTPVPALVLQNKYSGGDVGGQLTAVDDVTTAGTSKAYWTLKSTDASETFPVSDLRYGIETTVGEDPSHPGWLNTITSKTSTKTVQALTYVREGAGRVHERDDTVNGTTETFGYDGLERLVSWNWNGTAGARSIEYVYDDIGNLQQRTVIAGPGVTAGYTYGTNGFGPHQVSTDLNGTAYAYDPQGNQTVAPGGRSFTFDSFDRPTSVTAAAGAYTMTYDADLARFSRTDPAGNVRYSYGGLFEEHSDSAGDHCVMTVMAASRPVAEVEVLVANGTAATPTVNDILVDALGSIDALVGSNGKPQPVKYDPFGTRVQASDPTVDMTTAPQDLRAGFTGHEHDDDVDLIDMIGRMYDPVQQRFLSQDPPAPVPTDSQAWNPYAYVRNNPLNATDPTGYLEVLTEGVPFGTNGEDAYTQVPGAPVSAETPYGDFPGVVQGPTGTDGTGADLPGTDPDGVLVLDKSSLLADISQDHLVLAHGQEPEKEEGDSPFETLSRLIDGLRLLGAPLDVSGRTLEEGTALMKDQITLMKALTEDPEHMVQALEGIEAFGKGNLAFAIVASAATGFLTGAQYYKEHPDDLEGAILKGGLSGTLDFGEGLGLVGGGFAFGGPPGAIGGAVLYVVDGLLSATGITHGSVAAKTTEFIWTATHMPDITPPSGGVPMEPTDMGVP